MRVWTERIPHDVHWVDEHDTDHLIIVNLGGTITDFEATLAGGGRYLGPPSLGDMSIIPAGRRFGGVYRGTVARYASVLVDAAALTELTGAAGVRAELATTDALLFPLVAELATITDDHDSLYGDTLARALQLRLAERNRRTPVAATSRSARPLRPAIVRRLQEYTATRLHENIRLADLAAVAAMPTDRLLPAFRASFGTTPHQWVLQQRVRRARWLLTHTADPLASIAERAGFSHQSHLSSVFKAHTGHSPGAFRRATRDAARL